jgi:hypothetical protein
LARLLFRAARFLSLIRLAEEKAVSLEEKKAEKQRRKIREIIMLIV